MLREAPPRVEAPDRFILREVDTAWMNREQGQGRFENGVGEPDRGGRAFRNRYGIAL